MTFWYTKYTIESLNSNFEMFLKCCVSAMSPLVEHFKQERDNFGWTNDISKCSNLMMTIPNVGERRHFDTRHTL